MNQKELSRKQSTLLRLHKKDLELAYLSLSRVLSQRNAREMVRTKAEIDILRSLNLWSNLHIEKSFWIGKRCIDLFVPYVTGGIGDRRQRGLAIEVDGDVHFCESKMRRDQAKYELLHRLRIGTIILRNEDFRESSSRLRLFSTEISELPRLDFRAKKRLMRDIFIQTLLANEDVLQEERLTLGKEFVVEFKRLEK